MFHDRLVDETDREWFIDLIMDLASREFRSSIERDDVFGENKVMVGDLLKLDAPKRLYEVIAEKKKLVNPFFIQIFNQFVLFSSIYFDWKSPFVAMCHIYTKFITCILFNILNEESR